MKTLKLLSLFALAILFSHCGTTEPSTDTQTTGKSVLEVAQILDTIDGKFIDIARSNLSLTAEQVLVMTAEWVNSQPTVKEAYWFDSTYIDIYMKSGLRSTYMINRIGPDSLCLTRGGPKQGAGTKLTPSVVSKNRLKNKNILIFSPFTENIALGIKLYDEDELVRLKDKILSKVKGFTITLHVSDDCKLKDVESFGDYGIVIIDTHGFPDGFLTGDIFAFDYYSDTDDVAIKEHMDYQYGPGGYDKIRNNIIRLCKSNIIDNDKLWQSLAKKKGSIHITVTSDYLNILPSFPNTIILGNMCYSGWAKAGKTTSVFSGTNNVEEPIQTAFLNRNLISYYSYGFSDGTSSKLDNNFAKLMEDSLLQALLVDTDSTGDAHLDGSGKEFLGKNFNAKWNPEMPLKHFGADDYSYDDCIDTFTDARDGQKYKAACIGKQIWMAENLRYNAFESQCYDSLDENCYTFGRLYPWVIAMGGAPATDANPSNVQGICPKGWHIPSEAEWNQLFTTLGVDTAARALKLRSSLWKSWAGETNSSGFSAIPGGYFRLNGIQGATYPEYDKKGEWALFLSTSVASGKVKGISLQAQSSKIIPMSITNEFDPNQPTMNASCRCVKD